MSSEYDSSFFERAQNTFAFSQRFRQSWHEFFGTIRVVIQMLSFNYLLQTVPPPLNRILFYVYLLFVCMLGYLLIKQLYDKSSQRYDDIDLFDALFTRHVDDKLEFHEYMKIGFFAINLYFAIIWWKNDFEPV